MGAYDCDCTENLFSEMRERREKIFNQPKSEIISAQDPIYRLQMFQIIQKKYDLRNNDTKKVVEKIINFIENECLEWNNISCEWELK